LLDGLCHNALDILPLTEPTASGKISACANSMAQNYRLGVTVSEERHKMFLSIRNKKSCPNRNTYSRDDRLDRQEKWLNQITK